METGGLPRWLRVSGGEAGKGGRVGESTTANRNDAGELEEVEMTGAGVRDFGSKEKLVKADKVGKGSTG